MVLRNGDAFHGRFIEGLFEGSGTYTYGNSPDINPQEPPLDSTPAMSISATPNTMHIRSLLSNDQTRNASPMNFRGQLLQYKGNFHQGSKSGHGELFYRNGDSYCGQFRDNKFQGQGIYHSKSLDTESDISKYEGNWQNGYREGFGVLTYQNGDIYQGTFVGDLRQGPGEYFYQNQHSGGPFEKIQANFEDDEPNGDSVMTYKNGDLYNGTCLGESKHGYGVLKFSGSNEIFIEYKGNFVNDCFGGSGIMCFKNGDIFSGEWEKGAINGRGVYNYSSRHKKFAKYDGDFVEFQKIGPGKLWFKNGDTYVGQFE